MADATGLSDTDEVHGAQNGTTVAFIGVAMEGCGLEPLGRAVLGCADRSTAAIRSVTE
jgi:hypothetical protein